MSWLSRSLTGIFREEEDAAGGEFWDDPELFEPGAKTVKSELSELRKSLTQSLWGVAEFLAPPPTTHQPDDPEDSPVPEPDVVSTSETSPRKKLTGIQSDFAELKGGFAKGLSRLSSAIRGSEQDDEQPGSKETGLTGLLKPFIDNVLSIPEELQKGDNLDAADAGNGLDSTIPATLASHIDGISKLASALFPFVNDDDEQPGDASQAPGLTPEVLDFAEDISKHPETWLDFPVLSEEDGFEMSDAQGEHAYAIESCASRLSALKTELCPQHMSEERFWKIYFVLLHSRLSGEDASILSTPQVLQARNHLLSELRKEQSSGGDEDKQEQVSIIVKESIEGDNSEVVDKGAIPSTVKLAAASKIVDEAEADEWLEEDEASGSAMAGIRISSAKSRGGAPKDDEDDVSFSDLEDEDDTRTHHQQQQIACSSSSSGEPEARAAQQQGWVELNQSEELVKKHERAGSNDWLTVDKEDVTSGN